MPSTSCDQSTEHRPRRAPRDVEGEDRQRERAHRRVAADPAQPVGDVAAHVGARRGRAAPRAGSRSVRRAAPPAPRRAPARRTATTVPTAKRNAPTGGPTSWLVVRKPACSRALPTPRSSRGTSIGSSVPLALSANTSATPNRNVVTSTTVDVDPAGDDRDAQRPPRRGPAAGRRRRRAAAGRPGRRSRRPTARTAATAAAGAAPPCATSTGLRVCDATSSGPAARPMPSPRFDVHDDASSHRNPAPIRGGATTSRMRPTRSRTYPPDAVPSPARSRRPPARHPAPLGRLGGAGPHLRRLGTRPVSAGRIRVSFSATPHGRRRAHHGSGGSPPRERPSGVWPGHQAGG